MFYIDKSSKKPIYEQLYTSIVDSIISGAMAADTVLPATRKLAAELSISRNTINRAYHQLATEGYIRSHVGSGFIVNSIQADILSSESPYTFKPIPAITPPRYDFDYGNIDNQTFPYKQWRRSMNKALDAA